MLINFTRVFLGALLGLYLLPLQAAQPLVDSDWLNTHHSTPDTVVLDLQPLGAYVQYHVPGAVNSNYDDWRQTSAAGIPKMLPSIAYLETLIGGLGIDNATHVVLVVTGTSASEMAAATRVYWTFKALGHDQVSILDGGLLAYAVEQGHPTQSGINEPRAKTFKAALRSDYLVSANEIRNRLNTETTLVDNRSGAEFMGLVADINERPGTLPGALHLPYDWLTVNGGARFHGIDNLRQIYRAAAVPLDGEQILFCHTGHRTSLAWFVSHELLGNQKVRMYDGSTAEWAVDPALPIERKIMLE